MAEHRDQHDPVDQRRPASARLDVSEEVGSEAMLREAMDPANRSLTDALQLSFRVLQLAIMVLFVLFLFSGFKTVENNQSGVATLWGRILDPDGLEPGLQMNWPAPVGDFVLFQAEGRTATDGDAFTPRLIGAAGEQAAVQQAKSSDRIKPGQDGSFITSGGEIGHIAVEANWDVLDPVRYLEATPNDRADDLVELALQRAVVSVTSTRTLEELREVMSADALRAAIREHAQAMLDSAGTGIRIAAVNLTSEPNPPFFMRQAFEEYTRVRQQVEADVEGARQNAQERLISVAGSDYLKVWQLVEKCDEAWSRGDDAQAAIETARIDEMIDDGTVSGDVFKAISAARRYEVEAESLAGGLARRFNGLLESWRDHPELVIAQRLLDVKSGVLGRSDAELLYVPAGMGALRLDISGLQHIRDARRRADMEARENETWSRRPGSALDLFKRVHELKGDSAARQLRIEDGRIKGLREDD